MIPVGARIAAWSSGGKLYDSEVEWIGSNQAKCWFSFPIEEMGSGNNLSIAYEATLQLHSTVSYETLIDPNQVGSNKNYSFAITPINGINFVAGFNHANWKPPYNEFFKMHIRRDVNRVSMAINDVEQWTSEGIYRISSRALNLFIRGDLASYTKCNSGMKFGYLKGKDYLGRKIDIRAVRKGSVGMLYDAVTGELHESLGELPPILGPDCPPRDWELEV